MRASTVAALLRLNSLGRDDWERGLQETLRIDSEVLGVERVSYWSIREDLSRIFCELGYVAASGLFERGAVVHARSSPAYFGEIRRLQLIDASNALEDPRTRDLRAYLEAKNVGALLDAPVCSQGKPVGILCHEHTGGSRSWSTSDQEFALAVSQTLAAMLEARARSKAEVMERRSVFLSEVAPILAEALEVDTVAELAARHAVPTLGDMATLVTYEAGAVRSRATAHVTVEGERLLDEVTRRFPPRLDGPNSISRVIREKQSLIVPVVDPEALAFLAGEWGVVDLARALRVHSAMVVPLVRRGQFIGGMSFMSVHRMYAQDDLGFAEAYAHQVSGFLETARLYQQAQEAIRVRDEFLSLASHELRTPLTSLRASAEAIVQQIGKRTGSPQALQRMAGIVTRQVERLDRLSERILDASQIAGQLSLRPERVDLVGLVREVTARLTGRAERAGSPITVHAGAPVVGEWDPARLEQVVSDLLDNAIKFGAGHPIEVAVRSRDGRAVLTVRDHGVGISTEHLGRIFERYYRNTSARSFGGLGLGLYLVSAIVHAHGGTATVESRPGEGATFTVELPQQGSAAGPPGSG